MEQCCTSLYRLARSALGIANFLAAIAIILGALYGWQQYRDSIKNEMIKLSYSISHEYRSEHMTVRRNIVTTELNYDYNQAYANRMASGGVPQHEMCLGLVPIDFEDNEDGKKREIYLKQQVKCNALHSVLEYFDDALECVKVGGCDKETLKSLLKDDAESMWHLVSPFVNAGKKFGYPRYRLGIQCFAGILSEGECY